MVFSGIVFLYVFFPIVLVLYLAASKFKGRVGIELRNAVLLAASLFFYSWGEPLYLFLMLGVILATWLMGLWMDRLPDGSARRWVFIGSVAIVLLPLGVFKYGNFTVDNIEMLLGTNWKAATLALPVGISFYTFQTLSYVIDLYWRRIKVQKRVDRLALYVTLFPQLIAGPIVRYAEVETDLSGRESGLHLMSSGMDRFVVGLGKKVLIANVLGEFCSAYQGTTDGSILFAWLYAIAASLQLYYDFSGYSDMAIGLGTMFGFKFPENFRYPFISRSITEFWRRWHMTLGGWFRDYVYIPLGGSRVSRARWSFNLMVVWSLTGLWHGAAWNFVLWGVFFGVLLAGEKLFWGKWQAKLPKVVSWAITTFLVLISFMIFQSDGEGMLKQNLSALFSGNLVSTEALYYMKSYAVLFIVAAIGATPLPVWVTAQIRKNKTGDTVLSAVRPVWGVILLVICTAFLVDGSFNPFLYFRF